MKYTLEQIGEIITTNPNKNRLVAARAKRSEYMKQVQGCGCKEGMERFEYFESQELHNVKKKLAISNKDLFSRVLKEEHQVFTARGGSVSFNLSDKEEQNFSAKLDSVRFGLSLHKWVEVMAYEAFKVDPEGVIFIEVEAQEAGKDPKAYPTYKSTECIHDYDNTGRSLNYICFTIKREDYQSYGISIPEGANDIGIYYRWVDSDQDIIVSVEGKTASYINQSYLSGPAQLINPWGKVPGFIISNRMRFDNPKCFLSPLDEVFELSECYMNDRADRNIQKKLHGFAKAIEPLLKCVTCKGEGIVDGGNSCPDCTITGHSRGTGYKVKTKVSDTVKFPVEILEQIPGFDFKKIFGYATPPIEVWDKQDKSLQDIEGLIYYTYWGVTNTQMSGFNGSNQDETATKTLMNMQPKFAQLNKTANWGESTENAIADLIGQYYYNASWKGANIRYGRNYILHTADELAQNYYDMCKNGAMESLKDEALERYIIALYQNNPTRQQKYLKLMRVVPFPHDTPDKIEASEFVPEIEKLMKRFAGEWENTLAEGYIALPSNSVENLREELKKYAEDKQKELYQTIESEQKQI